MPTSQPRTLSIIHEIVQRLKPRSVIDLGIGHGKTGILLREYLEIMEERYIVESWQTLIYGIEAFGDYENPLWNYAYDEVTVCDAIEGLGKLPDVDLIIAVDVWEHFERTYAQEVLDICLLQSKYLLISTPMNPLLQEDVFGNKYERHVSKWSPYDFINIENCLITCTSLDWIILISSVQTFPVTVYPLFSSVRNISADMRKNANIAKVKLQRILNKIPKL